MQELKGDGWIRCTPGVLDRLAAKIQNRRRASRRTNVFAAVVSSTVLAAILGLGGVLAARAMGISVFDSEPTQQRGGQYGDNCPPPGPWQGR